jgi:hypothetical protein
MKTRALGFINNQLSAACYSDARGAKKHIEIGKGRFAPDAPCTPLGVLHRYTLNMITQTTVRLAWHRFRRQQKSAGDSLFRQNCEN